MIRSGSAPRPKVEADIVLATFNVLVIQVSTAIFYTEDLLLLLFLLLDQ